MCGKFRRHLIFIVFFLFISCENPLEDRVEELENKLELQEAAQDELRETIDSLIIEVESQNGAINSIIMDNQKTIDSLKNVYNQLLDSLNYSQSLFVDSLIYEQQYYIDSLIEEQSNYIDSVIATQQKTIQVILDSQISADFESVEIFSGICPTSYIDLDASSIVGEQKTLLILKVNRISNEGDRIVFRPNGETVDWLTSNGWLIDNPAGLSIASLASPKSALVMIYTDESGIIEMRANVKNIMTISVNLEFYLN